MLRNLVLAGFFVGASIAGASAGKDPISSREWQRQLGLHAGPRGGLAVSSAMLPGVCVPEGVACSLDNQCCSHDCDHEEGHCR